MRVDGTLAGPVVVWVATLLLKTYERVDSGPQAPHIKNLTDDHCKQPAPARMHYCRQSPATNNGQETMPTAGIFAVGRSPSPNTRPVKIQ